MLTISTLTGEGLGAGPADALIAAGLNDCNRLKQVSRNAILRSRKQVQAMLSHDSSIPFRGLLSARLYSRKTLRLPNLKAVSSLLCAQITPLRAFLGSPPQRLRIEIFGRPSAYKVKEPLPSRISLYQILTLSTFKCKILDIKGALIVLSFAFALYLLLILLSASLRRQDPPEVSKVEHVPCRNISFAQSSSRSLVLSHYSSVPYRKLAFSSNCLVSSRPKSDKSFRKLLLIYFAA